MIYDVRQFQCRPGTVAAQIKLFAEKGRAPHLRHVGRVAVFGYGETGDLDTYTLIVSYDDIGDRAQRRAALLADPEWQAYLTATKEAGNIINRHNYILNAAPFVNP